MMTICGSCFGHELKKLNVTVNGTPCSDIKLSVPHKEIRCLVPMGCGDDNTVIVTVDGQESNKDIAVNYGV